MAWRWVILAFAAAGIAACSKNMQVKVSPPECTVNEKTDCSTTPRDPNAMTEEPFFQRD